MREMVLTNQHLIHDDAQAPPITLLVVAILHEDFRGNVVRRANSRKGLGRERETGRERQGGRERPGGRSY